LPNWFACTALLPAIILWPSAEIWMPKTEPGRLTVPSAVFWLRA
jgi:hypothetical protein